MDFEEMQMARGSFLRVEDGRGLLLHVRDGELWITQEADHRDYYVKAGESFRPDRGGVLLAHALTASNLSLAARVRAGRLARGWANACAQISRPTTAAL